MPVSIKFLDEGKGVLFDFKDFLNAEEIISAIKSFYQSKESFRNNKYSIVKYYSKFDPKITKKDVDALVNLGLKYSEANPDRVIAVIAPENLNFAYSRMWEMFSDKTNWDRMVFRNEDKAITWLKKKVKERFQFDSLID